MVNPLQLYVLWRRPIGIWLAGLALVLQVVGHVRIALLGLESYAALAFILFLFAASIILLILRRASAVLYGTSFLMVGLYIAAGMFMHSSLVPFLLILIWCVVSFVGIAGLFFNRRWFDEQLVGFVSPDQ